MRWAGARQEEGGHSHHTSWGPLCWVPLHAGPGALPQGGRDWKELFLQEEDEGAPCPVEDELALHDNGFLSKNEVLRSKVSRLTERLRKRYPTNNFGTVGTGTGRGTVATGPKSWNCGYGFVTRVRGTAVSMGPI